jgi:uncharacterized membrane protein YkoI
MILGILPVAAVLAGLALAYDEPVRMSDLPPAVRQTMERETRGASVHKLSRETENGRVYYEAEMTANGLPKEVVVDGAGAVVKVEEKTRLENIPQAARNTIEQHAAGGQVVDVERKTRYGRTVYEAKVIKAGEDFEVKVTPEGRLIEID